jgi:hypothetical protein
MYLKISAMNEFFNPKVGLRALFSGPHWLAPYQIYVCPPSLTRDSSDVTG